MTDVAANQSEAAFKFDTGPWKHNAVAGVEISRERISLDKYTGLGSEALPGALSPTGALTGVNIFSPQFTDIPFGGSPQLTGYPTIVGVDTKSDHVLDTANYNDVLFLNAGIRADNYGYCLDGFGTVNNVLNSTPSRRRVSGW